MKDLPNCPVCGQKLTMTPHPDWPIVACQNPECPSDIARPGIHVLYGESADDQINYLVALIAAEMSRRRKA
jgi:hypothetical protein